MFNKYAILRVFELEQILVCSSLTYTNQSVTIWNDTYTATETVVVASVTMDVTSMPQINNFNGWVAALGTGADNLLAGSQSELLLNSGSSFQNGMGTPAINAFLADETGGTNVYDFISGIGTLYNKQFNPYESSVTETSAHDFESGHARGVLLLQTINECAKSFKAIQNDLQSSGYFMGGIKAVAYQTRVESNLQAIADCKAELRIIVNSWPGCVQ